MTVLSPVEPEVVESAESQRITVPDSRARARLTASSGAVNSTENSCRSDQSISASVVAWDRARVRIAVGDDEDRSRHVVGVHPRLDRVDTGMQDFARFLQADGRVDDDRQRAPVVGTVLRRHDHGQAHEGGGRREVTLHVAYKRLGGHAARFRTCLREARCDSRSGPWPGRPCAG